MTIRERNLRNVFAYYTLADLLRLDAAFRAGRVIKYTYLDQDRRGCLMYFLGGIESKAQLQREFGPDEYPGVHAVVQGWDNAALTEPMVRQALAETIENRQALHAAEEVTRRSVRRALHKMRQMRLCF